MKTKTIFLLVALISLLTTATAQHHPPVDKNKVNTSTSRRFVSPESFKKLYKKEPDYANPDNFIVFKGDTMIAIDDAKFKTVDFEYKDEEFLKVYKKVAFNDNAKAKDGKAYLKYWKTPLKIYFSDKFPNKAQAELKKFAAEISTGIDSLTITFVKNINDANYIIYTNGDFEYHSDLIDKEADYYINWKNSKINKGFLKIDRNTYFNDALFFYKMKELFIQTLGFFKLTNTLHCKSYFSNCFDAHKTFDAVDKSILKYHYSYGICKGINEETFDDLHQKANEHRKNNPSQPYKITHQE